ncbi:MAG: hypothetical protein HN833_00540 [Elusimicrobiaceae bacterium]|nr:hypothetical protein [Elusimicrobiaceae bacterium]
MLVIMFSDIAKAQVVPAFELLVHLQTHMVNKKMEFKEREDNLNNIELEIPKILGEHNPELKDFTTIIPKKWDTEAWEFEFTARETIFNIVHTIFSDTIYDKPVKDLLDNKTIVLYSDKYDGLEEQFKKEGKIEYINVSRTISANEDKVTINIKCPNSYYSVYISKKDKMIVFGRMLFYYPH